MRPEPTRLIHRDIFWHTQLMPTQSYKAVKYAMVKILPEASIRCRAVITAMRLVPRLVFTRCLIPILRITGRLPKQTCFYAVVVTVNR